MKTDAVSQLNQNKEMMPEIVAEEERQTELAEEYSAVLDSDTRALIDRMLESGVQYGRKKGAGNPKMREYLLRTQKEIDVFNLLRTKQCIDEAIETLRTFLSEKKTVLFVGTRSGSKEPVKEIALALAQPYVTERWLGGALTNFKTFKSRMSYFQDLKQRQETGALAKYPVKDRQKFQKELIKLEKEMGGLILMEKLPDALFIVDLVAHKTAVREARRLKIPIIALCGSDNNPDDADWRIPGNDKAPASIRFLLGYIREQLRKSA